MTVSVVIPNYNGESLLRHNLPHVYKALEGIRADKKEIVITDDKSEDDSLSVLKEFKEKQYGDIEITIIETHENGGFSTNVNRGVRKAMGEIIILLNTDVLPDSRAFISLLGHFTDPKVFAVGCMDESIEGEARVYRGRGIGRWERGFLMHSRGEVDKTTTLWVSGGSGAFRKSIWEKLGGLNEVYNPFYWEDIDLSYRAVKSGYTICFDPKSVVTHEHAKGIIRKKFSTEQISMIAFRNQLLFVWVNITDRSLLFSHLIWLPYHLFLPLLRGDTIFISGFFQALMRLPKVFRDRRQTRRRFVLSDKQILSDVSE